MSKVKTITATTTEQSITFDATYQFVWFRNLGDGDALVSDHSGIVAGADDVALVKAGGSTRITVPYNRTVYVKAVSDSVDMEIHAQNFSDVPFKSRAKGGGQSITVEPLSATDNGVYTAPTGTAYSPVTVDVQEEPWQPLQDGYSNFWFELTNDTLSPWLNFSAKTENATIDWGDGTGEQSLDTLTPTHTYLKAGKYVVKVKGVTGIAQQHTVPYSKYTETLTAVELNDEVTALSNSSFDMCVALKHITFSSVTIIGSYAFSYCTLLESLSMPNTVTTIGGSAFVYCASLKNAQLSTSLSLITASAFYYNRSISTITIPANITQIANSAFGYCNSLSEIHIRATTPPTVGTNSFANIAPNYIIYVPVGYGDTYKSAAGWSTYADHILEEGQTPTRAMVAKFNAMKKEVNDDGSDSNENR